MMSVTVVIMCDGKNCSTKAEFPFGCFEMGDFPTIDWSYDTDNEFYYCPSCVKKMIASGELED
jgi:hypothetical protein